MQIPDDERYPKYDLLLMKNIVILASGGGSNAQKIMAHFQNHHLGRVVAVFSNRAKAGVHEKAKDYGVPSFTFDRKQLYETQEIVDQMKDLQTDWVILAGFLWLVPANLIENFAGSIVNIHPALLPKYGGKGMYGHHVHQAVKDNGEKESGLTIHFVDPEYDKGQIILQARCAIEPSDSPKDIARKVLKLEHYFFPRAIESLLIEESEKDNV